MSWRCPYQSCDDHDECVEDGLTKAEIIIMNEWSSGWTYQSCDDHDEWVKDGHDENDVTGDAKLIQKRLVLMAWTITCAKSQKITNFGLNSWKNSEK